MRTDSLRQYVALRESLVREKAQIEQRLEQINRALSSEGGPVAVSSAKRIRNPMSLRDAVREVTKGKPLSKTEILEAVQKMGYRFTASNPMNSLNTVLYTNGQFKNQGGKFSPA